MRWAVFASNLANEVIFNLDVAQEETTLTAKELALKANLKSKLLGLAAVDRSRWTQRSRLT
jgi:hypothetical protein